MTRSKFRDLADKATNMTRNAAGKVAAVATGMTASGMALASGGSDPAGAITAQLAGLADSVGGIVVLLAAALAILILWSYVKKSR